MKVESKLIDVHLDKAMVKPYSSAFRLVVEIDDVAMAKWLASVNEEDRLGYQSDINDEAKRITSRGTHFNRRGKIYLPEVYKEYASFMKVYAVDKAGRPIEDLGEINDYKYTGGECSTIEETYT